MKCMENCFFFLYLSHLNRHRMCEYMFLFEVRLIGTPSVDAPRGISFYCHSMRQTHIFHGIV